jgi:hypothetical protein
MISVTSYYSARAGVLRTLHTTRYYARPTGRGNSLGLRHRSCLASYNMLLLRK